MATIAQKILEHLLSLEVRYKGGTKASFSSTSGFFGGNINSYKSSIIRLRKKGFIESNKGEWIITESGREFLKSGSLQTFESPFQKKAKRDLLFMFDVPEECRHYRDWLRGQLKGFGYIMIQQSVWVGPSPLPQEFKKYIRKLGLQKNIKTFKLAKGIDSK